MQKISTGNTVEWKWGRSVAKGEVTQEFTRDVERQIKGKTIKRKANAEEPAFLIRQEDGDRVLKSRSELRKSHG
jgi:hypothetical protein